MTAIQGKGNFGMLKRANTIRRRYSLNASRMEDSLNRFIQILDQFHCGGTFPITAAALARRNGSLRKYQSSNIEFAVHGYYHVDHTRLSLEQQTAYFERAGRELRDHGISYSGFRCPYLRWNADTLSALKRAGYVYDSSQALNWEVAEDLNPEVYRHLLEFYGAVSARDYPALPRYFDGLVRIPYSLPDDEALIERFKLQGSDWMDQIWLSILEKSYSLGECFTLGLHPERIDLCAKPLLATLERARQLFPKVWIARLDEITTWWKARTRAEVSIHERGTGEFEITAEGPTGMSFLARGVEMMNPSEPWDGITRQSAGPRIRFRADRRPFIGLSSSCPDELLSFLKQQGFLVERAEDGHDHVFFLDQKSFSWEEERPLLDQIERGSFPLVRLSRWPDGARSALSITGDIDALTLWDYGLRFLGR